MDTQKEIAKLKTESDEHKQALKEEFTHWVDRTKSLAAKILVVGGGLALAYIIAQNLFDKTNNSKGDGSRDKQNSTLIEIRNFILAELASFLLTIAKERLLEYLKETKTDIDVDTGDAEQ